MSIIHRLAQWIAPFKPVDEKGWQRLAISLSMFVLGVTFASWASRIPDVQHALSLNDAQLGMALFAQPLGQFPSMLAAPFLVKRLGARRLILMAAIGMSLSLVGVAMVPSLMGLSIALFVMGGFNSFLNIANNTQAVVVEKAYARSIMAKFHGCWSIGGVVGGFIGGLMASLAVNTTLHFILIVLLNFALLLFIRKHLIWDAPKDVKSTVVHQEELQVAESLETKTDPRIMRHAKLDIFLVFLGVVGFCSMLTEGTMYDWNSVYFVSVLHEQGLDARMGYLAAMIFMVLGRFIADGFINRFGETRVLEVSASSMIAGLALMVGFPTFWPSVVGSALVGIGMASVVPICYSLAGRSKHTSASAAISLVSAISFWGFLIGPPIIGMISQASSLGFAFTLVIVAPALILVLTPLLGRMKKKSVI